MEIILAKKNIPGKTNHYFGQDNIIDVIYPELVNF